MARPYMTKAWKMFILGLVGVGILFFVTRLPNLTALPIFTDEAIYIRWSQIAGRDANWRFISMTDGKQPLFTWIMIVTLRIFSDPLVAGRMVSVFAGVISLVGLGFLSYELFKSRRITLFTLLFYVFSPFSLMYDRLAIYDSLSASLAIWNVYLAILLVRKIRLDIALVFGLMLGAGMLNKTSGFIAIYLLPCMLILFDWKRTDWKKHLMKWIVFASVAFLLSQLVYGVLRLSPFYHMISQKDFVFVHPFKNWYFLFPFFIGNLKGLFDWLTGYLTWPVFLLAVVSPIFIWIREKKFSTAFRVSLLLLIYCFVPLCGLAYFGKVLYPRFILFMALPILILSAYMFDAILQKTANRWYSVFVTIIIFFFCIRSDFFIITNPKYAPIPFSDRGQLLDDWPAGYGVVEVIDILKQEAKRGSVAVFTEGTFGLFPYALEIYLVEDPNLMIKGIWPLPKTVPDELVQSALKQTTYFILNQTQIAPEGWPLQLVGEYQKGTNKDIKLRLFKVLPPFAFIP